MGPETFVCVVCDDPERLLASGSWTHPRRGVLVTTATPDGFAPGFEVLSVNDPTAGPGSMAAELASRLRPRLEEAQTLGLAVDLHLAFTSPGLAAAAQEAFSDGWRLCPFTTRPVADPAPHATLAATPASISEAPDSPLEIPDDGEAVPVESGFVEAVAIPGDSGEPWTLPPARSLNEDLRELRRSAQWYGDRHPETDAAREAVMRHPEATEDLARQAIQAGLAAGSGLKNLYGLASQQGRAARAVQDLMRSLLEDRPDLRASIEKQVREGDAAHQRWRTANAARDAGKPLTTVHATDVSHRIPDLGGSDLWGLFIDDTGELWSQESGAGDSRKAARIGRIIGLLVPDRVELPALSGDWHAAGVSSPSILDRRLQAILDREVGILGFSVRALPKQAGDLWAQAVIELVHWVLRLVTIERPTRVRVFIEQHGRHGADLDWSAVSASIRRQLAEALPQRASLLQELEMKLTRKGELPEMAYVDAVAHTWGSAAGDAKARLKASRLAEDCLHDTDLIRIRAAWDAAGRGVAPAGSRWRSLVDDPQAAGEKSVPAILLRQIGLECQKDREVWERYVRAAFEHLESKGVRLAELGREVAWLDRWSPPARKVPPALRLAWQTARLEWMNHLGMTAADAVAEIQSIVEALADEDPRLCCRADLDRAVLATNRFEFDAASATLSRWREWSPPSPGLQMHGRVLSSFGQHEAFRGQFASARAYFDRALEIFGRLSDQDLAAAEQRHTGTYRAIAAMDDPALSTDERIDAVRKVITLSPESVAEMAASGDGIPKYPHHLLLRFLTSSLPGAHAGDDPRRPWIEAYLNHAEAWQSGSGHPWQLIQLYRALLVRSASEERARELIELAWGIAQAPDQGPTVRLIGAAIGCIGQALGARITVESDLLDALTAQLPAAADRIEFLRMALSDPIDPLELLTVVLPFNFR